MALDWQLWATDRHHTWRPLSASQLASNGAPPGNLELARVPIQLILDITYSSHGVRRSNPAVSESSRRHRWIS